MVSVPHPHDMCLEDAKDINKSNNKAQTLHGIGADLAYTTFIMSHMDSKLCSICLL